MITGFTGQTGNAARPILKVGGRVCECTQCGLFFAGVGPFDRHLVGWGCRTLEQMQAVGMAANVHGVWQMGVSAGMAKCTRR